MLSAEFLETVSFWSLGPHFTMFNLILKGPTQHQLPTLHSSLDSLLSYLSPSLYPNPNTHNPTYALLQQAAQTSITELFIMLSIVVISSLNKQLSYASGIPTKGKARQGHERYVSSALASGRGVTNSAWSDWNAALQKGMFELGLQEKWLY